MKVSKALHLFTAILLIATFLPLVSTAAPQSETPFADPAFQQVWQRTDALVAAGKVSRSFYWGPQPISGPLEEDYAGLPNDKHKVQYFDKSRMEINDPAADKNNGFYVTNGLLTKELISGHVAVGTDVRQYIQRWPAAIVIAGDPGTSGPTYADFRGAVVHIDPDQTGQPVNQPVGHNDYGNEHGAYMTDEDQVEHFGSYKVKNAYFEWHTGHNIPDVFWAFLNAKGPVLSNGSVVNAPLSNPYFYATGYPISDAYWGTATIDGKSGVDVLIQPYERRVLTYVPSAPAAYKVQMGNIGQHYYAWRYNDAGKPAAFLDKCPITPMSGFGKLWSDNMEVKARLGCARQPEGRYTLSQQSFQQGLLISLQVYNFYDGIYHPLTFALLSPYGTPNEGYVGKGSGGLGFATSAVTTTAVTRAPGDSTDQGGVAAEFFDGGVMIYPDASQPFIYVLYNSSGRAYQPQQGPHYTNFQIDRWASYPDTFGK